VRRLAISARQVERHVRNAADRLSVAGASRFVAVAVCAGMVPWRDGTATAAVRERPWGRSR
jgi:hypothetical protein